MDNPSEQNTTVQPLLDYFNQLLPLDREEKELISAKFHPHLFLKNHFMQQQERIGQLFSSTAEERYASFLETYPHLLNRVSQVQIASYLGVTPEFLSRIRSRMAKGTSNP